jgi:hypothetical protein
MDRRQFLATSAAAITLALVGCVETSTEPETPTAQPSTPHDLFVVNHTSTTEVGTVRVVDADGEAVVDGRYELPSERGIEFNDIAARETAYTVALTIDGTDFEPLDWETPSCASVDEAPRGSRNGYVRVRRDEGDGLRATLAVDGCDEIVGPEYPTGPAQGFRVEE